MTFTPEPIDELELLALSNLSNTQEGLKVRHAADGKAATVAWCLHGKGLIDQPDGDYLTDLGLDAVEQAQDLLTTLEG